MSENPTPPKRPRPNPAQASPQPLTHLNFSLSHAQSKTALLIHPRQQNNPVLRHIRHVRQQTTSTITPDFQPGPTTAVLFLSLQYHLLHPRYIYTRLRALPSSYRLRILLLLCDVAEHRRPLHELTRLGLVAGLVVVVAGSEREAARYLETLRCYDCKGADGIQERVGSDYAARVNAALSSVRGVNRTDVSTLMFTFGNFRNLATVSDNQLRACPGVGERKVARLFAALHQPFRTDLPWTALEEGEEIEEVS